jgi:hypothetical protein
MCGVSRYPDFSTDRSSMEASLWQTARISAGAGTTARFFWSALANRAFWVKVSLQQKRCARTHQYDHLFLKDK